VTDPKAVKVWSGVLFAAPFMVSALMQPFWGVMGDRYGRKPMVVRAMLALALANILMGFAKTAPQLLVLRFFQGSLSGFVAPALALLTSSTPEDKTGQALGTLQSSLITGMIVGPLLGGMMAHFIGYRGLFFCTGLLCTAGGVITIAFVREDFARREGQKRPGLFQNLGFVFRTPHLRLMFLLLVLIQVSIHLVGPFLSLYVEHLKFSHEYVAMMSGFVFGITGVTNSATAPAWGRRGDKVGHWKVLRYCLAGLTLLFLPQAFVTDAYQLLALRAGLGVFLGGLLPTVQTIIQRSTEQENRGGIFGIFQSALLIGMMIGPLFGGFLSASLGLRAIFLVTTGVIFLAVLWERKMSPAQRITS